MEPRESFVFFRSFFEAVSEFDESVQASLSLAIIKYALYGEEPKLEGVAKAVFIVAKPSIDSSIKNYENGKKGGRPKKKRGDIVEEEPGIKSNINTGLSESKTGVIESKETVDKNPGFERSKTTMTMTMAKDKTKAEAEAKNITPKSLRQEEWGFGEDLTSAFSEWLVYKEEKRQSYKPTGLQSLILQVKKYSGEYGEKSVAELIRECMASNWQGIIWDRLRKEEKRKPYEKEKQAQKSFAELARELGRKCNYEH